MSQVPYENPPYDILERDSHFELRAYKDYIVAEVILEGAYESALSSGFRILADYIFGNNHPSRHMAMTAPVTSQPASEDRTIAMTASCDSSESRHGSVQNSVYDAISVYDQGTAGPPFDARITFRILAAHRAAAIRFSDSLNEANGVKRWKKLSEWMRTRRLHSVGPPLYANYSPPWIPPLLRRNEVLVQASRM